MQMTIQILNWIRDADSLTALVLTRVRGHDAIQAMSLAQLPARMHPAGLLSAWQALGQVRQADQELLYQLLVVLLHSQPADWLRLNLPEPGLRPLTPVKPTASHPRAYKGTRHCLPKSARKAIDLRPYLLDLRWVRQLLQSLKPHREAAFERLRQDGLVLAADFLDQGGDPWLRAHFPGIDPGPRLPRRIEQSLLPRLQDGPAAQVQSLFALISAWKKPEAQLPALLRLLEQARLGTILPFLQALAWHPLDQVLSLLRRLANDRTLKPGALRPLTALLELKPSPTADQSDYLRWALREGVDPDYLLAGLELARRHCKWHRFRRRYRGTGFDHALVKGILAHCAKAECGAHGVQALRIWERWGELPEFADLLRRIDWTALPPATATDLLEWLVKDYEDASWYGPAPHRQVCAVWACRLTPRLLGALQRCHADYGPKLLGLLTQELYRLSLSSRLASMSLGRHLEHALALCERLSRPPFAPHAGDFEPFAAWIEGLTDQDIKAFRALPDKAWQALETRIDLQSEALAAGLRLLVAAAPQLSLQALQDCPRRLLGLCRQLGQLPDPMGKDVTARFASSGLMRPGLETLSLEALMARVQPLCQRHVLRPPFARKLRAWQAGSLQLSQGQRERARLLAVQKLVLTRLDWLEALIADALFADYPEAPRTDALRHALLFQKLTHRNRRSLRRCLTQLLSGRHDYLLRHPLNQRWLARHPACDQPVWNGAAGDQALVHQCRWQDQDLTLALERDPFELLKMGTYVSSCLSLGGGFMYSAIAALLDINKQVVFARRADGRMVARQLLAVSEGDQLVGFAVYPVGTPPELEQQFLAFQQALAQRLGLPVYQGFAYDYEIPTLIAQDWYDDGAWVPQTEEAGAGQQDTLRTGNDASQSQPQQPPVAKGAAPKRLAQARA